MPNTKSAKKRHRQSLERRARNRTVKSQVRGWIRKLREACEKGDVAKIDELFRSAQKRFDQAAAKGVIHKNAASRLKSRLNARVKAAKAKATGGAAPAPSAN